MLKEFKDITRVVHLNKEEYDILISRPSKWGNPYTHIKGRSTLATHIVKSRDEAIHKYREWILSNEYLLSSLHELNGKRLGCFCHPKTCHGDILVELVEFVNQYGLENIEVLRKKFL